MSFIKFSKASLVLSAILVLASIGLLVYPGPKLSIEFTGGTLMELEGTTAAELESTVRALPWEGEQLRSADLSVTRTGSVFLRMPTLTNEEHLQLLGALKEKHPEIEELQFTTIGPTVGAGLKRRALWALAVASVAIVVYLAAAFRKVPRELSPWSFGLAAVAALFHDLLITVGIFVILSHVTSFQFDTLFVSALLSIMGYSVSDTIVIFDRIRENLYLEGKRESLSELADRSLKQTLSRTISTGVATMIMLLALFLFGAESIRWFMLALIVGTIIGTYSSFFVATPLIVYLRKDIRRR